jgi:hypothetical protein
MDQEIMITLEALRRGHDAMSVRVAALMAIIGAMIEERGAPDERRIIRWAQAIAQASGDQSQTAIQRMAMDLLRGLSEGRADTNPAAET